MLISSVNTSTYKYTPSVAPVVVDAKSKLYTSTIPTQGATATDKTFIYAPKGLAVGKAADAKSVVLENADGQFFTLDLGANDKVNLVAKGANIDLYVYKPSDSDNPISSTTKYTFDKKGAMQSTGGVSLSAIELSAAEVTTKRDLDGNDKIGVALDKTTKASDGKSLAATGSVFKVNVMGQDLFVLGAGLDKAKKIDLADKVLRDQDGNAWKPEGDFTSFRAVLTTSLGVTTSEVFATDADGAVTQFKFGANKRLMADTLDPATTGTKLLSTTELIAKETSAKRDLNVDGIFGAKITATLDAVGGIYKAEVGGASVYIHKGNAVSTDTTGGKPVNLDGLMVGLDGQAWAPTSPATPAKMSMVAEGGGFSVYVKTTGTDEFEKYSFNADFKQQGNAVKLTAEAMIAAEKTAKRDLSGDGKYGASIVSALDSRGGLYKGAIGIDTNVSFVGAANMTPGSKLANAALDAEAALKSDNGYWKVDDGYTIKAGFATVADDIYTVIAAKTGDASDVKKYVFDTANGNLLKSDDSGAISLVDLSDLENTQARDLNGDSIAGVQVARAVPDQLGGLYTASTSGQDFLVYNDTSAADITDLSQALLNKDGTAWSSTADRLVISPQGANGADGYKVYGYNSTDKTTTEYGFDTNFKLDSFKTRELTTVETADAEKAAERDLNGDSTIGARVTKTISSAHGLYEAKIGADTFTVVNSALSGNTTQLNGSASQGRALLKADGTAWTKSASFNVTSLVIQATSFEVYSVDGTDAERATFGLDGVLQKTDSLKADQIAISTAVEMSSGSYADKTGGLYKASMLGAEIYAVGTAGGATAPTDLSQALMVGNGEAWKPDSGFSVGGMVTNANGGYDVYTYKKDVSGEVTDVNKSSWDADLNYLGTATADVAALVDVEVTEGRDLNKDGAYGFKVSTPTPGAAEVDYKGVSTAKMSVNGTSVTYLLAGTDLKPGTASAGGGLGLDKVLLNAGGSAPWVIDSGYKVTAVDESGADRLVYAVKNGTGTNPDEVLKYTFDKTNGKVAGAGVAMTAIALAKLEKDDAVDLNNDGSIAAMSVSELKDADNAARSTGLLSATIGNQTYKVLNTMPLNGGKLDLGGALLDSDGVTAWDAPTGFVIKGTYQPPAVNGIDSPVEVYGLDGTDIKQFKFSKAVDVNGNQNGAYTLMQSDIRPLGTPTYGANAIRGSQMAETEFAAEADINGDGYTGYVPGASPAVFESAATDAWAMGTASVGTDAVYVVSAGYDKLTSATSASAAGADGSLIKNAALKVDNSGTMSYWKPDTGFTVKSIDKVSATEVNLWAKATDVAAGDNDYVKYNFAKTGDDWVLGSATGMLADSSDAITSKALIDEEFTAKQDLNGDGAVGLTLTEVSGSGTISVYKAEIDDQSFYVAGTNLASGTESHPVDLGSMLTDGVDANGDPAAYVPSGALTEFAVATAAEIDAGSGTEAYKLTDGGNDVFFDSSYAKI